MNKKLARIRRATRTRKKLFQLGATKLVVHRTSRHIYAQIISYDNFSVLVSASTLEKLVSNQLEHTSNKRAAILVGKIIAQRAIKIGIVKVSFDRSGFKYHGRVKVLANSARQVGLKF